MSKLNFASLPVWSGCALLLLSQMAAATVAAPVTIDNSTLQLHFDLEHGTVQNWLLPELHDANGQPHDMAAPVGELFALKGELAGKSLEAWETQAGGWKVLERQADTLVLELEHPEQPFTLKKTWHLQDQQWRADFKVDLDRKALPYSPSDHLELKAGPGIGETPARGLGMGQSIYSFTELVYRNADGVETQRLDPGTPTLTSTDAGQSDWVGLQSRYLALILNAANDNALNATWQASVPQLPEDQAANASFRTSIDVQLQLPESNATPSWQWNVYGGGKAYSALTVQSPDLGGLLFSSLWDWMRGLCLGIMHVLQFIQQIVGSWGLAIILLAFLVRLAVYPVAKKAIAAQKKFATIQARIQPELQEIRRTYKGGEQAERILQLYESHQVSPLAGLKPLLIVLIQVPIFVALFHLLGQTFELREASFLWIKTLAEPDQLFPLGVDLPLFGAYFNLLPVLMAFTTLLSIKLASVPDGQSPVRQAITSGLMGLGFFLLFYSFPSGMVLYWTVANILQVAHQKLAKD